MISTPPAALIAASTEIMSALSASAEAMICMLVAIGFAFTRNIFTVFGQAKARRAVKKGQLHFHSLADHPERVLTELRLGQRLAITTATLLLFEALLTLPWAGVITVIAITFSTVLLVEAVPRWIVSPAIAERWVGPLLRLSGPWRWLARPIAYFIELLGSGVSRRTTAEREPEDDVDRLTSLIADHTASAHPDAQHKLKQEIAFGDTLAREIMMPRGDVVACNADASPDQLLKHLIQYSRIPIYRKNLDNIIGVLYAKDVLIHLMTHPNEVFQLDKVPLRETFFVPDSRRARDLFEDMRRRRVHLAVVIDEFGGFSGIVSMEDVIELFFGDIQDEYDSEVALVSNLGPQHILADAKLDIETLRGLFDVEFPEDRDYDTLGGFITAEMGKVPLIGESFSALGLRFTVRDANPRRVIRVEVQREELPPVMTATPPGGSEMVEADHTPTPSMMRRLMV